MLKRHWRFAQKLLSIVVLAGAAMISWGNEFEAAPPGASTEISQEVLSRAGVDDIVSQLAIWLDEELRNVEASGLNVTDAEINDIRRSMKRHFMTSSLTQRLRENVAQQFDQEALLGLQTLLLDDQVLQLHGMMADAEREYVKARIREYKAKLKNHSLRNRRVELLDQLVKSLGWVELEIDLKVELRKSVLNSVSWIKAGEWVPERELDQELESYRQRLRDELYGANRIYALYLFRRIPTDRLERLVKHFRDPDYTQLMQHSRMLVTAEARMAREQSRDSQRGLY